MIKTEEMGLSSRKGGEEKEGVGGKGEKWPKQCMHIWINEWRKKEESTFSCS
jgi:hypothetical protein